MGRILDELPDELGIITSGSGNGSPAPTQPVAVDSISTMNMNGVSDVPPLQKTIDPVLLKQQNQNLSQLLSGNSNTNNVTTNGSVAPPSAAIAPSTNLSSEVSSTPTPIKPASIDNPMMINVMQQQPQQMMNNMNRPGLPMHSQMQNNPGIIGQMMNDQQPVTPHQMSPRQQLDQMHNIRQPPPPPQQQQQPNQQIHQQSMHYGQIGPGMNNSPQMSIVNQLPGQQTPAVPGMPANAQMVQGQITNQQPGHLQQVQINNQIQQLQPQQQQQMVPQQQLTPQQQHLQQQQQMQMKIKVSHLIKWLYYFTKFT